MFPAIDIYSWKTIVFKLNDFQLTFRKVCRTLSKSYSHQRNEILWGIADIIQNMEQGFQSITSRSILWESHKPPSTVMIQYFKKDLNFILSITTTISRVFGLIDDFQETLLNINKIDELNHIKLARSQVDLLFLK